MVIELTAVISDGSRPAGTVPQLQPRVQPLAVPAGEDVTLRVAVKTQDGEFATLTGGSLRWSLQKHPSDVAALTSVVVSDFVAPVEDDPFPFNAVVTVPASATTGLEEEVAYHHDLWWTTAASKRSQIIPWSPCVIGDASAPG